MGHCRVEDIRNGGSNNHDRMVWMISDKNVASYYRKSYWNELERQQVQCSLLVIWSNLHAATRTVVARVVLEAFDVKCSF